MMFGMGVPNFGLLLLGKEIRKPSKGNQEHLVHNSDLKNQATSANSINVYENIVISLDRYSLLSLLTLLLPLFCKQEMIVIDVISN